MSFNPDQPHQSPEGKSDNPKKSKKSQAQVAAEHQMSSQLERSHRAEQATTKAELEIAEQIELPWDYLGFEPKTEATKNQLVTALVKLQTQKQIDNPDYRVADTPTSEIPGLRQELNNYGFCPKPTPDNVTPEAQTPSTDTDETTKIVSETPDQRNSRIRDKFLNPNFPECPPEAENSAVAECVGYEDIAREFNGADYALSKIDLPDLKPVIDELIKQAPIRSEKEETKDEIAAATEKKGTDEVVVTTNDTRIDDRKTEVKVESDKTPKLKGNAEKAETTAAEAESDLQTIKENYLDLKSKHGSIRAVEALIGMMKSPKMRGKLNRIMSVIGALQNAIPGKSEIVNQMLNGANLNLGSESMVGVFSDFVTQVDASSEFTDEEKGKIHKALHSSHHVTGSAEAKDALKQGRGTVTDPETGETKTLTYDKDHKLEAKGNTFYHYGDNGEIVVSTKDGWEKSIDPNTPHSHLRMWTVYASVRATYTENGFEKYGNYSFDKNRPEPFLKKFNQVSNDLLGGSRGLDSTFYSEGELEKLVRINKFIAHKGEIPVKADESRMSESYKELGVNSGNILDADPRILKEVGSFFQENPSAHGEKFFEELKKRLVEKGLINDDDSENNDNE